MQSTTPLPDINTPDKQQADKAKEPANTKIEEPVPEGGTDTKGEAEQAGAGYGCFGIVINRARLTLHRSFDRTVPSAEAMEELMQETAAYNTRVNAEARHRAHIAHITWISKCRATTTTAAYDSEADADGETDDELPAMLEKKEKKADTLLELQQPSSKANARAKKPANKRTGTAEASRGYAVEELTGNGSEEEVEYVPRPTSSRGVKKSGNP